MSPGSESDQFILSACQLHSEEHIQIFYLVDLINTCTVSANNVGQVPNALTPGHSGSEVIGLES